MKERLTKLDLRRYARLHWSQDGPDNEVQSSDIRRLTREIRSELTQGSRILLHTEEGTRLRIFSLTQNAVEFGFTSTIDTPRYTPGPSRLRLFAEDEIVYARIKPFNTKPLKARVVAIDVQNSQGLRSITLRNSLIAA